MGTLTRGQVVLVPFPFSDLRQTKLRPAAILAFAGRNDWILCQITSNPYGDQLAVELKDSDFQAGSLHVVSYARPGKLFTANEELVKNQIGVLKPDTFEKLIHTIISLLKGG